MAKTQYYGTGRRKSSVARVRLIPGNGNITVNKKPLDDYLAMEIVKREVKRPFEIAGCEGKFDVIATVHGGGYTGQAGALRHGISRALCEADREAYRPALKAAGFLTRDSRMKMCIRDRFRRDMPDIFRRRMPGAHEKLFTENHAAVCGKVRDHVPYRLPCDP